MDNDMFSAESMEAARKRADTVHEAQTGGVKVPSRHEQSVDVPDLEVKSKTKDHSDQEVIILTYFVVYKFNFYIFFGSISYFNQCFSDNFSNLIFLFICSSRIPIDCNFWHVISSLNISNYFVSVDFAVFQ